MKFIPCFLSKAGAPTVQGRDVNHVHASGNTGAKHKGVKLAK